MSTFSTLWRDSSYRAILLGLLVVGGASLAAFFFLSPDSSPTTADTPPSDPPRPVAPDFDMERMNGDRFRLSDHRGTIVIVNFWATWCPPCRREIPDFIKLQEEFEGRVQFVGVSMDRSGFEAVRPYAQSMGINYPLVVDDGTLAQKYGGVPTLPTTFGIGPDGTIHFSWPGYLPASSLRSQLQPLLDMMPSHS